MPDTSFTDYVTTIVSTWLNQANKLVFWGRRPNVATTTGSANAQILTLETGSLYSAGTEADGDEFVFLAGFTNAAAMTLQVLQPSGTNVARAVQLNGAALTGGEVIAGQPYRVTRKSTTWQLTSLAGTAFGTTLLQQATATATRAALGLNDGMATGSIVDAKGDIITATADNTPVRKAVGSNGQIIVADSTQSDGLIWTDFSKDPLNVNPNMLIDQINEGALYTVNSAGTTQGLDGWSGVVSVSGGVFKMRQVADPDNAAKMCLEITCTTADAAVGATDLAYLFTDIEGYDSSSLSPGTASAGSIVTMLETRSLPAGVYGIRVTNSAGNRAYVSTFTTSGAAAWQQHYLTLTLDTTGTWLYTNGTGVRVQICLMAGANYQGSTGSWGATTNFGTASQVNFLSSTSNIGYLRMHVIPGNVVCAYKPADIQRELAKAQRYLYVMGGSQWYGMGLCYNATDAEFSIPLPTMRAAPSFSYATATYTMNDGTGTNTASALSLSGSSNGVNTALIGATGSVGAWSATYRPLRLSGDSSGRLRFNARLS